MDPVKAIERTRSRWLVSRRYRLLYGPIAKVANTSFRTWMLRIEGLWRPELERVEDLIDVPRRLRLWEHEPDEIAEIVRRFYRFAFVRSPFTRLASAYLNKFVDRKPVRMGTVHETERRIRRVEWVWRSPLPRRWRRKIARHWTKRGVSFREFVEHVARTHSSRLDKHWAPQVDIIGAVGLDFLGRFESLKEDVARLNAALAERPGPRPPPIVLQHRNRTDYAEPGGEFVGDALASELRKMTPRPHVTQLYDGDIARRVVERFREDFERFGYSTSLEAVTG